MADLIHLQVVAPAALRGPVIRYIEDLDAACNVVVLGNAARQPHGDVVTFDVPREAVNEVLEHLEHLGVVEHGSITVFHTELTLSRHAERAHADAPGDPDDTVIWNEVTDALRLSASPSFAYLAFFVVAAVIGATGVLTDSAILIVGAMVVGPEYAPLASVAYGISRRDADLIVNGGRTFLIGTGLAVGAAALVGLLVRAFDQVPRAYALDDRPMTSFITNPDVFTVIVAAAAAVAGMLALTHQRSGTLVGVLISVTTIPAIAEIGVQLAMGDLGQLGGAATQLGLNLTCIIVVGMLTIAALRRASPEFTRHPEPAGPAGPPGPTGSVRSHRLP